MVNTKRKKQQPPDPIVTINVPIHKKSKSSKPNIKKENTDTEIKQSKHPKKFGSIIEAFRSLGKETSDVKRPTKEENKQITEQLQEIYWDRSKILWYPIFSEKKHHVQIDLMFVPKKIKGRKKLQAILNVIYINSRYAFSKSIPIKTNVKKAEEAPYIPGESKKKAEQRIPVHIKDAKRTWKAFKHILDVVMPAEARVLNEWCAENNIKSRVQFQVKYVSCDGGSEFQNEFAANCKQRGIHIHTFKPETSTKRGLYIVERFHKTLRRIVEKQRQFTQTDKEFETYIPDALDVYNRELNHRGLENFFRRYLKKNERFQEGRIQYSPAMFVIMEKEQEYIDWKQRQTALVEQHYQKEMEELMKKDKKVKVWKKNQQAQWKEKAGKGTVTGFRKVVGRHKYKKPGHTRYY